MSEEDLRPQLMSDPEKEARAAYEAWKWSRGTLPWRLPFAGLFTLGLALALFWESLWRTPHWWALVTTSLFLITGTLNLFYDIPRKRLSRASRLFLLVVTVAPLVLLVLAILWKELAIQQ